MSFVATVWVEDGWVKVRWPYNRRRMARVKDAMKDAIPYENRKWAAEEKCWHIDASFDETLMEILEKHCDEVIVIGAVEPDPIVPQLPSGEDPSATLLALCPDRVLPKVWRTIAAALHPDAGGDVEAFKQANNAWEALRAARGV